MYALGDMNRITGALLILAAVLMFPGTREDARMLLFVLLGGIGLVLLIWGLATDKKGEPSE